ncbi:hypothetical protein GW17_00058918, partial [Ensete ventricosum]
MRTVLEIFEIQRGRIILFSKGCPSHLFVPLCAVAAAATVQAAGLVAGRSLATAPLQACRGQSPLAGTPRAAAPCDLAAGGNPLRASRSRLCPRAAVPCKGLVAADRPFAGGPWLQLVVPLQVTRPCPIVPPPRCLRCENAART